MLREAVERAVRVTSENPAEGETQDKHLKEPPDPFQFG